VALLLWFRDEGAALALGAALTRGRSARKTTRDMLGRPIGATLSLLLLLACGDRATNQAQEIAPAAKAPTAPAKVGYDLRRLRPVDDQPLGQMFDRLRAQTTAEGKQVAVLFSANWCESCQTLELELGNLHPAADIGHVRVIELVEEDWERVTRMNEFEALRQRWDSTTTTYPLFVVLDPEGAKREEMKEAIERLEQAGVEATLSAWFRGLRSS